jgi:protoporphyrinogen oxidase
MQTLQQQLPAQGHHDLREGELKRHGTNSTPDSASTPEKWAVVGGGILGMTMALRLRQQGKFVTLFEADDHLGGLADAWEFGGVEWDRHYHVTLLSDGHLRNLLRELDLDDDMNWVETKTGFYTDGKWYSMSNSVEFLKFPPLSLIDKFRLGATIFYASKIKNPQRLEKVPVTDWLTKLSGKRVFEKIWLPLLKAKLGENYRKASASFIWAIIARMYAARHSGLKKEMFGYLEGGYARFLKNFTDKLIELGVEVRTSTPIESIRNEGAMRVRLPGGVFEDFDQVAVTVPSSLATKLCPDLSDEEQTRHANIEYQGIICASVLLNKPLKGYYVTNITDDWVPFTAIIEMSTLVDPKNFGGKYLAYLPKYVTPDDPMFEMSDAEIESVFVAGLRRMVPEIGADDILAFRLSRVRNVLALATLGYSENLPPMSTSVAGLHIVNSAHINNGTLNVNECVQLAETAAANFVQQRVERES